MDAITSEKRNFSHLSGDAQFHSRVDSVFASLGDLEKKHEEALPAEDAFVEPANAIDEKCPNEEERLSISNTRATRPSRSAEKTQRPNRKRPAHVPDHVLHPKKWKKYSLEDDGSSEYGNVRGNALNKQVALSFLDDLRKRKSLKESQKLGVNSKCDEDEEKHKFSKPIDEEENEVRATNSSYINIKGSGNMDDKVTNLSGHIGSVTRKVHLMDTYEFGQAKPDIKSDSHSQQKDKLEKNELPLSHLMVAEEENKVDMTDFVSDKQSNVNDPTVHKCAPLFKKATKAMHTKRGLRKRCTPNDDDDGNSD